MHLRLVEDHSIPIHRAEIRRRSCNDFQHTDPTGLHDSTIRPGRRAAGKSAGLRTHLCEADEGQAGRSQVVGHHHAADRQRRWAIVGDGDAIGRVCTGYHFARAGLLDVQVALTQRIGDIVVARRIGCLTQCVFIVPPHGRQVRHLGVTLRVVGIDGDHGVDSHTLTGRNRSDEADRWIREGTDARLAGQRIGALDQPGIRLGNSGAGRQRVGHDHVDRVRRPGVADEDLIVERVVAAQSTQHGEVSQVLLENRQIRFRRHGEGEGGRVVGRVDVWVIRRGRE